MDDLETEQLTKLGFVLPVYFRYIDDILIVLPKCKIENILEGFNSNYFNIKFTLEKEVNKSITFLDSKFRRDENWLITCNCYRNPKVVREMFEFRFESFKRIQKKCHLQYG